MFQPSTTNILPIVNPSITQDFKSTGYNWQRWAKWGLLSAGGLAATAAIIYGGPMIFTGLFSLMTGVAAKLSGDGQGNALAPFEPSNMLMMHNPVDIASPATQGGLDKDDWLAELIGSTSKELPEYLKDTIKEQPADLDKELMAEDTADHLDGLSNLFYESFLDKEKTLDDLERDHVLAEPPSAKKTDTDIIEISSPAIVKEQKAEEGKKLAESPLRELRTITKRSSFPANIELSSLDGTNGFILNGVAEGDQSGWSVASAGDINGDSIADSIVGAWGASPSFDDQRKGAGISYVVFGHNGTWGSPIDLSILNGTNGFKIAGEVAYDQSGRSVAGAGDINGDSIADLIVSTFMPRNQTGRSYVVFGHNGTWFNWIDLLRLDGTNGFKLDGEAENDQSGWSVASAGDVNGDGIADLIVGAYGAAPFGRTGAGKSYVIFGQSSLTTVEWLWLIGLVMGLISVTICGSIGGFFLKRYLNRRAYIKLESEKLPFKIIRQIGRGGNAEVYEGEWIKTGLWHGKHVAIKKLPDIFTGLAETTHEFTEEARFLEEYRHPNLIEFIRFFAAPHWCLVLKYYYRGSLDKVLTDEHYLLPWNPERNGFMKGIAEGLKFLHEKGIIHRDMKPGNVLIGEDMTPKITDLGTARIQDTLSMTKGVGTPAYIAPEIIKAEDNGKIRYTNSVDVYSYGLILWAIWQRKEPFANFEDRWHIMKYVIDEQNRPLLEDCPSPSLANLMSRCWAHRPDDRPKMPQVCDELKTITAELAFA